MATTDPVGRISRARLALAALLVYGATRLVSTAFIAQAVPRQVPFEQWTGSEVTFLDMSVLWDGSWYRHIVENGYPDQLPIDAVGNVAQNAWAFYPLFP